MEQDRIRQLLTLDKNFAINSVNALKDLKERITNNIKDNQQINVRIARALTSNCKEWRDGDYCYTEYSGLTLSVGATSSISLKIYLNNKKETIVDGQYSCAYCRNRYYEINYINGDAKDNSYYYSSSSSAYTNTSTKLYKDKWLARIDKVIADIENEIEQYNKAIEDTENYLNDRDKLIKEIDDFNNKYSYKIKDYKNIKRDYKI